MDFQIQGARADWCLEGKREVEGENIARVVEPIVDRLPEFYFAPVCRREREEVELVQRFHID